MGGNVSEELLGKGVYLAYTGGCAALAASKMKLKGVFYEELGMAEAVWVIEVDRLPLTVGIDSKGNDLYRDVSKKASENFQKNNL
jgi:fumarate hydratase subunit beta